MSKVSEKITRVEVETEFRICQQCGYERGFHASFVPGNGSGSLQIILICPDCGARYDVGKTID
jgi:hypothetical protein